MGMLCTWLEVVQLLVPSQAECSPPDAGVNGLWLWLLLAKSGLLPGRHSYYGSAFHLLAVAPHDIVISAVRKPACSWLRQWLMHELASMLPRRRDPQTLHAILSVGLWVLVLELCECCQRHHAAAAAPCIHTHVLVIGLRAPSLRGRRFDVCGVCPPPCLPSISFLA